MTTWNVYPHSKKFSSGLEIDFVEDGQTSGSTTPQLAAGDPLIGEYPDNDRFSGKVLTVVPAGIKVIQSADIEIDNKNITIRSARPGDAINPMKSSLSVIPWIVI